MEGGADRVVLVEEIARKENRLEEQKKTQWDDTDAIDLLDLVIVLAKRKRLIAEPGPRRRGPHAIVSLVMPPVFLAETKILSPQTSSSMAAQILSQLGAASVLLGGAPAVKSQNEGSTSRLSSGAGRCSTA